MNLSGAKGEAREIVRDKHYEAVTRACNVEDPFFMLEWGLGFRVAAPTL